MLLLRTSLAIAVIHCIAASVMLPAGLQAQPVPVTSRVGALDPADSTSKSRLQRVVIVRHDIYDSADARGWYRTLLNRVHVRTQQRVVERELLLRSGDLLDSAKAAETGRNLRRLQVFRDVEVDTSSDGSTMRVITRDGWTTQPYAGYRSTGNQKLLTIGILETNFLGLAATLDARYSQDPDRSTARLAFGAPRLFRNRISSGAFYNRFSDGSSVGVAVEQPFFSLSSRNAVRAGWVTFEGRVLRFRDGFTRPADSLDRRFTLGTIGAAHALRASPRGYLRVGLDAQLRRDDFVPRRGTTTAIPRSITAAAIPYLEVSKADFLLTRNYRALGQPEDVNLSSTIRLGIAVAPKAFGYARDGVGPVLSAQTGLRIPHGFVQLSGRVTGLASAGAVDSGTANVSAIVALQPSPRQLLVAFTGMGWDRNPYPGEEFDLGLSRGPRAFQLHAFTGDRQRYSTIEYRYTVLPNILSSFALAVAGFAETGGAWYDGSPTRTGSDAGVGVRLAPLRTAALIGATRFDLVRRFANDRVPAGWLVVVGTGFTFDALR
ncbi:MAG: hypothetical protein V4813_14080 [Gemmatimonadota bacterium]